MPGYFNLRMRSLKAVAGGCLHTGPVKHPEIRGSPIKDPMVVRPSISGKLGVRESIQTLRQAATRTEDFGQRKGGIDLDSGWSLACVWWPVQANPL